MINPDDLEIGALSNGDADYHGAGGNLIGPLCDVGGPVAVECSRVRLVDGYGRSGAFAMLERMATYSSQQTGWRASGTANGQSITKDLPMSTPERVLKLDYEAAGWSLSPIYGNNWSIFPLSQQAQTRQGNDTPTYTQEQKDCDIKLAKIFGGSNAVGAGNGFEPSNLFGKDNKGKGAAKAGRYRGGGDTGHLSSTFHLYYSNAEGENAGEFSGDIFIPEGGNYIGENPYSNEDSYLFIYKSLGSVKNVLLVTSHVKGFKSPNGVARQKTKIGEIGGYAGDSSVQPFLNPFANVEGAYIHSHLAIRSYTYQYNKKTKKNEIVFGKRHSFFDVFCKK